MRLRSSETASQSVDNQVVERSWMQGESISSYSSTFLFASRTVAGPGGNVGRRIVAATSGTLHFRRMLEVSFPHKSGRDRVDSIPRTPQSLEDVRAG